MLVDLQRVPAAGRAIDCQVAPSRVARSDSEFRMDAEAELHGRLEPAPARAFRLRGSFRATPVVPCVRCLEPFELPLSEEIDLSFLPQANNVPAGEDDRGLEDEELAVSFYQDEEIDLAHLIWEQIVLALPMKPVCRADCAGLCPSCGVNRNESSCDCVVDAIDPRWQSLRTLLEPERAQE